jgi:gentisate 1,2-dioxygenase
VIDGERCEARRGDLIPTPNGTSHGHGDDGASRLGRQARLSVDGLDCVWLDEASGPARVHDEGYSHALRARRDAA